jgi:TolA-binding protein
MDIYWPIAAVKAHYWLGVAYQQQGKTDQAIKEYETFLDFWKNADFKSPEMQDARTRLAKLKGVVVR